MIPMRWLACCSMLFGSASLACADQPALGSSAQFRIVGYLPDYRPFQVEQAECLTDLIVFSAQPTEGGGIDLSRLDKTNWPQLQEAKRKYKLRIILCIGGWERSTHFARVAASEQLRNNFVMAARQICIDKQLDGIDLDWEHPRDAEEQNAYASLLQDLQRVLHPDGRSVSITMAAWQVVPRTAFEAADWVQLMAYDHPGRHSTIDNAQADVGKLVQAGAPRHKIVLGLPFYGRGIDKADRTLTYRQIFSRYQPDRAIDEVDGIYFNSPATIERKTRYSLDTKLAGVMIWEIGQDAPGESSLLRVITQTLKQPHYRIEVQRAEDRVDVQGVDQQPVFVVTSPTGIGSAVVYRPASGWPNAQQITLRLKLKGLEQLRITAGELQWSVTVSSSDHKPTIGRQSNKQETAVTDRKDPYWTDVKTTPTFEMKLPQALFGDNPNSITVQWIDFFR